MTLAMPESPPRDIALAVDVLVTWIAGIALGRYVWALSSGTADRSGRSVRPRGGRSLLERRARLLVGIMAVLLLVRGFAWLAPDHRLLDFLVFAPVALLPVAMTLFAEALLRRHAPMWIKCFATAATVVALAGSVARGIVAPEAARIIDAIDLAGLAGTLIAIAWLLARRQRASLSAAENALVRICVVVAAIGVPLAITDYRTAFDAPPVRFGAIGALVFCYSLLRLPEENTRLRDWLRDVGMILGRAIITCGVLIAALGARNTYLVLPLSTLATAVILAFAILDRIRESATQTSRHELLGWLARATPHTTAEFAAELARLSITGDAAIVDDDELAGYDAPAIAATFSAQRVVYGLAELRRLSERTWSRARGADQLADLLERRWATHVALLRAQPLRLLVTTVPELGNSVDVELALAAVARRGERMGVA